jgi:nitroimidazol reductase NimA-like FMN-containing flavoprotein (pyridoxamine 5'-phosphate oxidase superfamily)
MQYQKTNRSTVKRGAKRATYDKEVIHSILDAGSICFAAFMFEGKPFVQPINYGRKNETLYMHGSLQNRMTTAILAADEVCLNVTLLDGMLLTRSAFHHSVNYRSAIVFGKARELITNEEKLEGIETLINHFVPNRWQHCRKPTGNELKATRVIAIDIISASAKTKNTAPNDNEEDLSLDFWAGTIPIKHICEKPFSDERTDASKPIPEHVLAFYEKNKNGF